MMTEIHKKIIIKMYLDGQSPACIAEVAPYTKTAIESFLKREGCMRSHSESAQLAYSEGRYNKGMHSEDKIKIIKMYLDGKSPLDLSKIFTYSYFAIVNFIHRNGFMRSMSEAAQLSHHQGKRDISKWKEAGIESIRLRSRDSTKSPRYIKDRSKVKAKRCYMEEKDFMLQVMVERNFKCELTGKGGNLSVHHIKPVYLFPQLIFEKSNVIVVLKVIHLDFHRKYSMRSTEEDWINYVHKEEYVGL